jgi:hypothetical protein
VFQITNPGNFYDTHIDHPVGVGFLILTNGETMSNYLNKNQSYILDMHLRENIEKFNHKGAKDIAKICSQDLGFDISPSTIINTRNAMVSAGVPVWEPELKRKHKSLRADVEDLKKQVAKQVSVIVEQDKKFAVVFAKLHALTVYSGNDVPLSNGDDEEGESWDSTE